MFAYSYFSTGFLLNFLVHITLSYTSTLPFLRYFLHLAVPQSYSYLGIPPRQYLPAYIDPFTYLQVKGLFFLSLDMPKLRFTMSQ